MTDRFDPTSSPADEGTSPATPSPVRSRRRFSRRITAVAGVSAAVALSLAACGGSPDAAPKTTTTGQLTAPRSSVGSAPTTSTSPTSSTTSTTPTTTAPTTSSTTTTTAAPGTHGPLTTPPLPAAGAGFVAGHVTAIGDSVMLDYQTALEQDVPGVTVDASVSRQWSAGETLVQQLKASGQLGAVVIIGLGTNGPISTTDFNTMMSLLAGASRVVFVNVHVDRTWQDPNNAVLAAGVARYPNAVLVDWNTLASQNPGWLYSTATHLPINGPGAQALAALVAGKA
ncbi:MAG TPA: hypothetical protein VHX40_01690 [Acidimicrobiales bacterium]|nr:hypothetical protein [Acidimicrobiales bacterium]